MIKAHLAQCQKSTRAFSAQDYTSKYLCNTMFIKMSLIDGHFINRFLISHWQNLHWDLNEISTLQKEELLLNHQLLFNYLAIQSVVVFDRTRDFQECSGASYGN